MEIEGQDQPINDLAKAWDLPYAATLGSSVRSKGIFLEVRARLPVALQKSLSVKARVLSLRMSGDRRDEFVLAARLVDRALATVNQRPVIPRELEDILAIKPTERHRWLKDGRLPSAGTRTVTLRGRARKITFHVFDPPAVEDILDRNLVDHWREEDAERRAESRQLAAGKARPTRAQKALSSPTQEPEQNDAEHYRLRGWAEFKRESGL